MSIVILCTLFVGCSSNIPSESAEPSTTENTSDEVSKNNADSRGIPGASAAKVQTLLTMSPFNIPQKDLTAAPAEAESTYAYSCTSIGFSEDDKFTYDYSLTLDSDEEIIGASFGISTMDASFSALRTAADLYFYAVGLMEYDGADSDALTAWLSDNLPNASKDALTTTVGAATFNLYTDEASMYFLDVSKAE